MHFFEHYYENIIRYDLLNKFAYKNIQQLPKLKKIVLSFKCRNSDSNQLISSLVALELITSQKPIIIKSKISNISFKIRKGNPVGCKLVLRKTSMYIFFARFLLQLLPNYKILKNISSQNFKSIKKSFSFEINKILFFPELENQYQFFNRLGNLQIIIVTNSKTYKELIFLLKSFKFFFNSKYNSIGRV